MQDALEGATGLIIRGTAGSTATLQRQIAALRATGFTTVVGIGVDEDPIHDLGEILTVANHRPNETGQLYDVWLALSRIPVNTATVILFDDADPYPGVIECFGEVGGISAAVDPTTGHVQLLHVAADRLAGFRSTLEYILLDQPKAPVRLLVDTGAATAYRAVFDGSSSNGSRARWLWPSLHPTGVIIELDDLVIDLTEEPAVIVPERISEA